ncbi:hypothetical protein BG004_004088 [Podila humilis]|nr:hypothetical protein BG004_004088 [Podila humilis]
MHSVPRAGRVMNARINLIQLHSFVLRPSKAIALQDAPRLSTSYYATNSVISQLATQMRSGPSILPSSSCRQRPIRSIRSCYGTSQLDAIGMRVTQPYSTSTASSSSVAVRELEQLISSNDIAGFQQALTSLQGRDSAVMTKEVYHYLLKCLCDTPSIFSPVSADSTVVPDPLNSAIGILTEMSREANINGKTALQPDKETLMLLLRVAGSKECIESQRDHGWESAWLLVDAIRHGRLPAVMSPDQWELPDLNITLDQDLWKAMFKCVHAAGVSSSKQTFKQELDITTFFMADQLSRSNDADMDDQLWGYVIEAFGSSNAGSRVREILPILPPISTASQELYATVAEALAKTGSGQIAANIIDTLYAAHGTLSSIKPIIALGRHYAATGDYETLRRDLHIWENKGTHTPTSESLMVELHRNFLSASAVALARMVNVSSSISKNRQSNVLPENVLPGMTTPPLLSGSEYREAWYLSDRSTQAWSSIPVSERTAEDYNVFMQIQCRLSLLKPSEWPVEACAITLLDDMKKQGLKPSQPTYRTLMETLARRREHESKRDDGKAFDRVMKVYNAMVRDGYAPTSASDFQPLLEACFTSNSASIFAPGMWIYTNQYCGVATTALRKVEDLMRDSLQTSTNGAVQQYHDSTTLATTLAGLAHGDKIEELYERWNALPLHGVERDAYLYQTLIGASQGQEKLARHVLRTVRHEILKERPPIHMTPAIFAGLLNCCVRTQDAASARSLISQYSGDIKKTSDWYVPMVRTCLMTKGMEHEGEFLLEEMKKNDMKMDSTFYELLMEYFVTKRGDYGAGREVFKSYVKHEQDEVDVLVEAKKKNMDEVSWNKVVMMSERNLSRAVDRLKSPVVDNLVSRVEISQTTATMLNLLVMAHLRERALMLEQEKRSGFNAGSAERLKDAQTVMHYLTGETRRRAQAMQASSGCGCAGTASAAGSTSSSMIPSAETIAVSAGQGCSSSSMPSTSPSLLLGGSSSPASPKAFTKTSGSRTGGLFVNKHVLGEYIDACIKEGSPAMLEEAQWALDEVVPRIVDDKVKYARESQRLRQTLGNAWHRHEQQSQASL